MKVLSLCENSNERAPCTRRVMKPLTFITLMIITLFWGLNTAFAKPFFSVKPGFGVENAKLLFANCKESEKPEATVSKIIKTMNLKPKLNGLSQLEILSIAWMQAPCSKHPRQAFSGFSAFQEKHKTRKTFVYAFVKQKTDNRCKLYCFDGSNGDEQGMLSFEEVFKEAKLLVEDVYYDNDWHTILILAGITETQGSLQKSTQISLFDITHSPILNESVMLKSSASKMEGSACFINKTITLETHPSSLTTFRQAKDWLIGVAGSDNGIGTIYLMSLNHSTPPILLATREKAKILNWLAVDTQSTGYVDKIYAVDDQGSLWAWTFTEQKLTNDPKKLLSKKINPLQTTLLVVPCLSKTGVELFYFSKTTQNKVQLQSILDISHQEIKLEEVKSHQTLEFNPELQNETLNQARIVGDFQTAYSRFGRIILVPKYIKDAPKVISRSRRGIELRNCEWKIRAWKDKNEDKEGKEVSPEISIAAPIIQSILIWIQNWKENYY